jgi:hypothetical protein
MDITLIFSTAAKERLTAASATNQSAIAWLY